VTEEQPKIVNPVTSLYDENVYLTNEEPTIKTTEINSDISETQIPSATKEQTSSNSLTSVQSQI